MGNLFDYDSFVTLVSCWIHENVVDLGLGLVCWFRESRYRTTQKGGGATYGDIQAVHPRLGVAFLPPGWQGEIPAELPDGHQGFGDSFPTNKDCRFLGGALISRTIDKPPERV
jgi:hypothetical protein